SQPAPPPPPETKPAAPPIDPSKINLAKAKADLVPDAKTWFEEWRANSSAAREKDEAKIVELSGGGQGFSALLDNHGDVSKGVVYLKAGSNDHIIRCATTDRQPWATVSPGSGVKVRGIVPQYADTANLDPCIILEASANPAITISAIQLTKEH